MAPAIERTGKMKFLENEFYGRACGSVQNVCGSNMWYGEKKSKLLNVEGYGRYRSGDPTEVKWSI